MRHYQSCETAPVLPGERPHSGSQGRARQGTWKKSDRSGFTLIEVVIAMGIISVGLIAIVGLIPVGLDSMNDSVELTVESQVMQSMAAEIRQSSFDTLERDWEDKRFYYDWEGVEVGRNEDPVFEVRVGEVRFSSETPSGRALKDRVQLVSLELFRNGNEMSKMTFVVGDNGS